MFSKILALFLALTASSHAIYAPPANTITCSNGVTRVIPGNLKVVCGQSTATSHYARMKKSDGSGDYVVPTLTIACAVAVTHDEAGYHTVVGKGTADAGGTAGSTSTTPTGWVAAYDNGTTNLGADFKFTSANATANGPPLFCMGFSAAATSMLYSQISGSYGTSCVYFYEVPSTSSCNF